MNNERDIAMNTQPYAEDLGVMHTDHVAPGNAVEKIPAEFVCFSQSSKLVRKLRKSEDDSYDLFVWSNGKWQFRDNITKQTAIDWYRFRESDVYVR